MDTLHEIIHLNVGGHSFHILSLNLLKYPESWLGRLAACDSHENRLKLCDYYVSESNEYGYNKSPSIADSILNFYRTGALHLPDGICAKQIEKELEYWQVPKGYVSLCCAHKLSSNTFTNGNFQFDTALTSPSVSSGRFTQFAPEDELLSPDIMTIRSDDFAGKSCGIVRRKVWQFTENPLSSIGATV